MITVSCILDKGRLKPDEAYVTPVEKNLLLHICIPMAAKRLVVHKTMFPTYEAYDESVFVQRR